MPLFYNMAVYNYDYKWRLCSRTADDINYHFKHNIAKFYDGKHIYCAYSYTDFDKKFNSIEQFVKLIIDQMEYCFVVNVFKIKGSLDSSILDKMSQYVNINLSDEILVKIDQEIRKKNPPMKNMNYIRNLPFCERCDMIV